MAVVGPATGVVAIFALHLATLLHPEPEPGRARVAIATERRSARPQRRRCPGAPAAPG
jgi:hypothetical protein